MITLATATAVLRLYLLSFVLHLKKITLATATAVLRRFNNTCSIAIIRLHWLLLRRY